MVDLREQLRIYRERYALCVAVLFTVSTEAGHQSIDVHDGERPWQNVTRSIVYRLKDEFDSLQSLVSAAVFAEDGRRKDRLRQVAVNLRNGLNIHPDTVHVRLTSPGHMHNNQPVRPVALTVGRRPEPMAKRHRELLYSMLITTVEVRQAIDSAALSPLDESLLIPEINDDGVIDLEVMTVRAVDNARTYSRSNLAAIHWRGRPTGEPSGRREDVAAILGDILDPRSTAELLDEMHMIKRARQYLGEDCVVLACPIPGVLAGPHTPAAGVLLMRRAGRGHYSSHTIALGRGICIRLAVIRATSASGEVARLISSLSDLTPSDTGDGKDAPSDERLAIEGMEPALRQIAANTNSHSATIRLARGRVDTADPHGLVLERVVAAITPETAESLDLARQQETAHGGLNWRVARTGRFAYAADVAADTDYVQVREATRSQLSVPVRAAGQLIGTLNLESASRANYGTYLPYVQAIADAIGRRFATASLQAGRPVLERAAQVLDRTHTYQTRLLDLRHHARSLPLNAASLDQIDEYVKECLDLIGTAVRAPQPVKVAQQVERLGEVVDRALRDRPVLDLEVENDWSAVAALNQSMLPFFGRIVHSATRTILSNMKEHAGAVYNRSAPTVWFGECRWDGYQHAVVVFTNGTDLILPPAVADQVYRVPIDRNGELRLGAHLAGLQLQMVGGWISFGVDPTGLAKTVLLVPIDPTQEG